MTAPTGNNEQTSGGEVRIVPGRCYECHVQCAMLVHVRDGRVVKVEGDPHFVNQGTLCAKGIATVRNLYHPERLELPAHAHASQGRPRSRLGPHQLGRGPRPHRRPSSRRSRRSTAGTPSPSARAPAATRSLSTCGSRTRSASPNTLTPSHVCRGPNAAGYDPLGGPSPPRRLRRLGLPGLLGQERGLGPPGLPHGCRDGRHRRPRAPS